LANRLLRLANRLSRPVSIGSRFAAVFLPAVFAVAFYGVQTSE
jgi:hypothetical protein